MKRLVTGVIVCLALVALSASPALAQRGGGRGGRWFGGGFGDFKPELMIGLSEQLQKELKITDEQKEKIKAIGEEARNAGGGFGGGRDESEEERTKRREARKKRSEETVKKIDEVLTPEQVARLRGISLQMKGIAGLVDPETVKELKLTDEQVKQLKVISEETAKKRTEAFAGMGRDSTDEERSKAREKIKTLQKDAIDEAQAVLTAEQKTAYEKLKGEKFELQMPSFGGRGGRGGDRNSEEKKSEEKKVEEKKT